MIKDLLKKNKDMSVAVKASLWFVICSFIQRGISLITTPIFTRILSTSEYGQYTVYVSWMDIFSIIVTFKLSEAVFNKSMISSEKQDRRSVLASYQMLVVLLWSAFFLVYILLREVFNYLVGMNTLFMLLMFAEIFMTSVISLWTAYQRFEYNYKLLIAVTLLIAILNPVLGLIIIRYSANHAVGRILGIVISQSVVSIWLLIYNLRFLKRGTLRKNWKYALSFNLPLIPHYLSQIILSQADRIMIDKLIGKSEAGLYGAAYTVGMLGTMITHSINNAYVPWMYRELKKKNFKEVIANNIVLLVFLEICIFCIFVVAPEAMYIIGGEKYIEATNVIYPVAISVSFMFTYGLFANIEYYYEKRIYVMIGTCAAAVLNLVLNYIFLQIFGYIAAAYTTLFCYFCYGAFHIFIVPRIIQKQEGVKIKIPYLRIFLASLGLIISSVVMQYLKPYPIIRYIILAGLISVFIIKRKSILQYYKKLKTE